MGELDTLFELIGGSEKCSEWGVRPRGLRNVNYNPEGLDDFIRRREDAIPDNVVIYPVMSVEEAIRFLEENRVSRNMLRVSRHKISCACLPHDVPSALSIYFRDKEGNLYNLCVLGIDYLV